MEIKSTGELDNILKNTNPNQLEEYLSNNKKYMVDDKKAFYYYMKDVLDEKQMKLKDLYISAGVSESYGGSILRMERHTKNRDLIIKLCIAGHFTWDETKRALKLYGMNELYAKNPRDAVFIVAINNRIYDFYKIDEMLISKGFDRLSNEE
ncbi:hypothetical protein SAMN02910413_1226 [Pseudobutyrivibrio sp. C4]|uniref:hypothetical protein n=1 Tax=Pseudobutyrivibrio sp. C4 TaxID=1520803 RepID=UPI0008BE9AD0|nr:hypothetical protein [Pseudobutyrivibrio sp. C4]SES91304.1 hypothetical protein SAMN02910413_1226 [Pseudobutyrivibrio sp. C4]